MTTHEAKLQVIRMLIEEVEETPDPDEDVLHLHDVMTVYERLLLRSSHKHPTTLTELLEMQGAVDTGNKMLGNLVKEEADAMKGWYHGIHPDNKAMALANLLSRMTLELSKVIRAFLMKYPTELNHHFNRRLAQYANVLN